MPGPLSIAKERWIEALLEANDAAIMIVSLIVIHYLIWFLSYLGWDKAMLDLLDWAVKAAEYLTAATFLIFAYRRYIFTELAKEAARSPR